MALNTARGVRNELRLLPVPAHLAVDDPRRQRPGPPQRSAAHLGAGCGRACAQQAPPVRHDDRGPRRMRHPTKAPTAKIRGAELGKAKLERPSPRKTTHAGCRRNCMSVVRPCKPHKQSTTLRRERTEATAAHAPTCLLLLLASLAGIAGLPCPGQQRSAATRPELNKSSRRRRREDKARKKGNGARGQGWAGAGGASSPARRRRRVRPLDVDAVLPRRGGVGPEGGRDVRAGPELRRGAALRDVRRRRQRAAALHPRRPRRPADQGAGPAVQPVRVADDAQLVRAARAAVADGGRHRHAVEPAGHRHRAAQQRREGADAGHVRLPQRHLALPLLRRDLPELHRFSTGGERAPRGGALPVAEPRGGSDHLRGGLRGVAQGAHPGAQRVGPRPLHVPGLAHAQDRRRLAAAQRHGPRQPPPARLHLQARQGGRRGHRLRVALRRREPVRYQGDGEGDVPQPRRVGRHERPVQVAGARQLLQGPPEPAGGVQGQLGAAAGHGQHLPRQVREPVAQLHRRRLLQEERPRRRGGGHGQGERRPGLRLREHIGLQRQRDMHSPARQDAQRHLQRLIRRGGVEAAAAGAAMAAAHPAAVSPCSSSGHVNSAYLLYRRIGLAAASERILLYI